MRIFGAPAIVFLFRVLILAILAFLIAALIYRTAVARFTVRGGSPWLDLAELDRQDAVDALDDLLRGTPRLREKVEGLHAITKEKIRRGAPGFQVDRTLEDGTLLAVASPCEHGRPTHVGYRRGLSRLPWRVARRAPRVG